MIWVAAIAVVGAAGAWWMLRPVEAVGKQSYYFDESAGKLFTSASGQLAPIAGSDGPEQDGVLAIVYSCGDDSKAEQKIAYLQKLDPELKGKWESWNEAHAAGESGPPEIEDRGYVSLHTLVRRPDENEWHAKSSREGQAIIRVLTEKCANGEYPHICDPSD